MNRKSIPLSVTRRLRVQLAPGSKIMLGHSSQDDIPSGTVGEVIGIDDAGTIHVKWATGKISNLFFGEDSFTMYHPAGA